ncbi:hypothetical protein TNCV_2709591 [Trichonephila clavipes]|nr:hypothetical protein TNCV_2709591 [Trichonephila clavipes]
MRENVNKEVLVTNPEPRRGFYVCAGGIFVIDFKLIQMGKTMHENVKKEEKENEKERDKEIEKDENKK